MRFPWKCAYLPVSRGGRLWPPEAVQCIPAFVVFHMQLKFILTVRARLHSLGVRSAAAASVHAQCQPPLPCRGVRCAPPHTRANDAHRRAAPMRARRGRPCRCAEPPRGLEPKTPTTSILSIRSQTSNHPQPVLRADASLSRHTRLPVRCTRLDSPYLHGMPTPSARLAALAVALAVNSRRGAWRMASSAIHGAPPPGRDSTRVQPTTIPNQ